MSATKLLTCIPFKDWSVSQSKDSTITWFISCSKAEKQPFCQGMVRRLGAGSVGYGLGVPERAGSPAMGAPGEEPSGSVCSGSDTHDSVFFRGVLPQGGLARLRETVPCGYAVVVIWKLAKFVDTTYLAGTQLRRRLTFSIACKVTIYMWQQTT